ncbi:MAG: type II toxin-antitoxin system PemK/MazF family toxin [Archaeoglobus sp.]|nr:type II toxin-antitoxin system PemK/MazF family toxin [Archaeoglobus sp.]
MSIKSVKGSEGGKESKGSNRDIRQRDVVLLWFPFSDLSAKKKRPVLVLSSDDFNRRGRDLIVCQITSRIGSGFTKYNVPLRNEDMESGHLKKESVIKPYRIFTANRNLIAPTTAGIVVGNIKPEKFREVLDILKEVIYADS